MVNNCFCQVAVMISNALYLRKHKQCSHTYNGDSYVEIIIPQGRFHDAAGKVQSSAKHSTAQVIISVKITNLHCL